MHSTLCHFYFAQRQTPSFWLGVCGKKTLAMTYSRMA